MSLCVIFMKINVLTVQDITHLNPLWIGDDILYV